MLDGKAIIANAISLVKTLAPLLPYGQQAADVVRQTEKLVATVKATFSHEDTTVLDAELKTLVDRVNAHADQTIASLSADHQAETNARSPH